MEFETIRERMIDAPVRSETNFPEMSDCLLGETVQALNATQAIIRALFGIEKPEAADMKPKNVRTCLIGALDEAITNMKELNRLLQCVAARSGA